MTRLLAWNIYHRFFVRYACATYFLGQDMLEDIYHLFGIVGEAFACIESRSEGMKDPILGVRILLIPFNGVKIITLNTGRNDYLEWTDGVC